MDSKTRIGGKKDENIILDSVISGYLLAFITIYF